MNCSIKIPSTLYFGQGSYTNLTSICESKQINKVLLFTDKGIRSTGILEPIEKLLKEAKIEAVIYDDIKPEPSYQEVERIQKDIEAFKVDAIIAVGGGSVMDTAKLCSVLVNADYTIKDILKTPLMASRKITTIMIPTTCGTGSEATVNAIVAIPEENTKQGIVNPELLPDYVILDPEMIRKLPKSIIAATGVDALAHVVECYTSNKATQLSNLYALAGAKLIFNNIRKAYLDAEDMEAKEAMMLGAFYGGVAITGSGTTAVHALSYPLGGRYHIPHGVSNAILLAQVMEFNKDACIEQLATMCDDIYPTHINESKEEKADYIIKEIKDIVKVTEIPTSLTDFGVKKEDLEELVKAGSEQTRLLNNNIKKLSLDDIRLLYKTILD